MGWRRNLDSDPLFKDPDNGDFTLSQDSPCRDAGIADWDGDGVEDVTDYNGSAPDMGAFESQMTAPSNFSLYTSTDHVIVTWLETEEEVCNTTCLNVLLIQSSMKMLLVII